MSMGGLRPVEFGERLYQQVRKDDVPGLAAELAYRFVLALFPFFIFLAALGGFVASALDVANPTDRIMDTLGDALPSDAASVVRRQLETVVESQNPGLLSIGLLGAVWAAAGGINAIIKAMNRAYDVPESRPFWKKYPLAVGLTLLSGAFVIGAFVLLVAGQVYGQRLADWMGVGDAFGTVINLARWPVVVGLLLAAMAFLYWAAPNINVPFRWITPGAVLFTVVWLAATFLFGLYVANFGSYNATYGALGGFIILLIWFYLTGFILLVGAEVNAITQEQVVPEVVGEERRQAAGQGRERREAPKVREPAPTAAESGRKAAEAGRAATLLGAAVAGLAVWRVLR